MTGKIEYTPFEYICSYLSVRRMTPKRLCVKVILSYFFFIKTSKSSCLMLMMLISVGRYKMAVNPSVALCRSRVTSAGLVAEMVVCSCGVKLTYYVEDHCGLDGNIIRKLDNGAFEGLIYSLLVLTD